MKNLRNICIGLLVISAVSNASPSESKNEVESSKIRVRRYAKASDGASDSESVKRQKLQKRKQAAKERSELVDQIMATSDDQFEMSTSVQNPTTRLSQNMNSANGPMPTNNFNTNMMGFSDMPRQLESNNNPYAASGLQNYANNFPYPGYQAQSQLQNPMGYFYGNPNLSPNGQQAMIQPQGFNSFLAQQQQQIPAAYGGNFVGFPGFLNYPGFPVDPQAALQPTPGQFHNNFPNQQGPQPGFIGGPEGYPPSYASNFMGHGLMPQQNPIGPQNHPASETTMNPMNALDNNINVNGQQGPLPESPNMHQPNAANNFLGYGSFPVGQPGLPNNPNLNFGPQMPLQPSLPQQQQQQQLQINPFAQPQDPFNNGILATQPFGGSIFTDFRQQRELKAKDSTEKV